MRTHRDGHHAAVDKAAEAAAARAQRLWVLYAHDYAGQKVIREVQQFGACESTPLEFDSTSILLKRSRNGMPPATIKFSFKSSHVALQKIQAALSSS